MKTVKRGLAEHSQFPEAYLEIDPQFERTLTVVDLKTNEVIGYITIQTAEEAGKWAATKSS